MVDKFPDALTERFHPTQVRKNPQGQDYVAIDGYINRLNDVLGTNWHWEISRWEFHDGPPTAKGKPQYIAVVSGMLSVYVPDAKDDLNLLVPIRRDGIGSGMNFDPDTAAKTAQAEALKKACHQFGIALYLWDEGERNFVEKQRRAVNNDSDLKKLIMDYTIRELGLDANEQPTREQIIECLGSDDLSPENMRNILTERNII